MMVKVRALIGAAVALMVIATSATAVAQEAGPADGPPPLPPVTVGDLTFGDCPGFGSEGPPLQCATVEVPLDHDVPDGPTTQTWVIRFGAPVPPEQVKGNLFVNPGGPGGDPLGMVLAVALGGPFEGWNILAVVPRGTGFSRLSCDAPAGAGAPSMAWFGGGDTTGEAPGSGSPGSGSPGSGVPSSGAPSSGSPGSGSPGSGVPHSGSPGSGAPTVDESDSVGGDDTVADDTVSDDTASEGRDASEDSRLAAEIEAVADDVAARERLCRESDGAIVDHLGSVNVAGDMEAVRVAMGEDRLNFLGASYGTHLGAVFAELYPDSVGRFILDGPVLLDDIPPADLAQIAGVEDALNRMDAACAAFADQCAVSDIGVRATIAEIRERLGQGPIPGTGQGPDGPVDIELSSEMFERLLPAALTAGRLAWIEFVPALALAVEGDATGLFGFAQLFEGGDFSQTAFVFVACSDDPVPLSLPEALESVQRERDETGSAFADTLGVVVGRCARSGLGDPVPPIDIAAGDTAPILIVANTHDASTPYAGALDFAAAVRSGRLLTVTEDGHTIVAQGNTCVDAIALAYLNTGELPDEGTVCGPTALIGLFPVGPGPNGGSIVGPVTVGGPSDGLVRAGDEILSFDGVPLGAGRPVFDIGVPIEIVLVRDGAELAVTIVPEATFWIPDDSDSLLSGAEAGSGLDGPDAVDERGDVQRVVDTDL